MISALAFACLLQPAPPAQAEPKLEMVTYQMVFLREGPTPEPAEPDQQMQMAHLAYLAKLNRERLNLLYGPFSDEQNPRGLLVLDVPDAAAAKKLMADDPFVKAGHLTLDVKPWMGPKGWFQAPAIADVTQPGALEDLVFGILVRGPNRSQSAAEAAELQKGHLAYMDSLHKQGKLIMAGPFMEEGDWRGVVVYRVASLDEAKQLAEGDPMVKAGRLVIEARPWVTLRGILR